MLTPEYLDSAPNETLGVIDEFEKYVIAEVARRLVQLGYDEHSEAFRRKLKMIEIGRASCRERV